MLHSTTRRSFLTQVTAAGTSALGLPNIISSRAWAVSPNEKLRIAAIGFGGRMQVILSEAMRAGENLVAICDADARQIPATSAAMSKKDPELAEAFQKAKIYADYRKLLEDAKSYDAVLIATGNRWHTPLSIAFMRAGKHVYCEKPLSVRVPEARELARVARECSVVTQMGTQGTASADFRKAMEIVQSGILGPIREGYCWDGDVIRKPSMSRPDGEDPVPEGLNWDMWIGPAPYRPFKNGQYLGLQNWWPWFDFGAGKVTEFGTHTFQLPIRALKLGHPIRVENVIPEPVKETYGSTGEMRFDFAARGEQPPVTLRWYDGGKMPPAEITRDLELTYGKVPRPGCLLVGEKGSLYAGGWGSGNVMMLKGEPKMHGVLTHEAAKDLPVTEPRLAKGANHMNEFLNACKGSGKTYSPLEVGAHSMELLIPGVVSLRMGRAIEWDGANMKVPGAPEADEFIQGNNRKKWLV